MVLLTATLDHPAFRETQPDATILRRVGQAFAERPFGETGNRQVEGEDTAAQLKGFRITRTLDPQPMLQAATQ
jgi:hypothetical protein